MTNPLARSSLIIAHRGFSTRHPENSLEAFEAAIAAGADVVETDVRLSRDGKAMCSHDADLKRLRGRVETIAEVDAEQLERYGIIRLETALAAMRGRVKVMLDLKETTEAGMAPGFRIVADLGMGADIFAGARTIELAPVIRSLCPQATLIALVSRPSDLAAFHVAGCAIGRLWEEEATKAGIAAAKASGQHVWITTGAPREGEAGEIDAPRLRRLMADGADGIIVNDPAQAHAVRVEMHR
jgi:glycerophosphoryl diester phosphodiesterase